jgi:hypothetical protein
MFDFIKRLGLFRSVPARSTNSIGKRNYRPRLDVLEDRLVPASFVWQTPWEVSFDSDVLWGSGESQLAFGETATTNGEVTDTGQTGDQGPASAVARAWIHTGIDYAESLLEAKVSFHRTFQLSDSPAGWQLNVDALLEGVLSGQLLGSPEQQGWANVDGTIRVDAGTVGGADDALLSIGLTDALQFEPHDTSVEKTVSLSEAAEGLILDGTYTVSGYLFTSAYTGWDYFTGAAAYELESSFFDPPGFLVTVDAVALPGGPPIPEVTIGDTLATEGNTGIQAALFTVSLSSATIHPVTLNYSTADGTATTGADYLAGRPRCGNHTLGTRKLDLAAAGS